ncbi:helix-turn-helix domain-containing protein, partial [Micromonospora echinofusca]
MTDRTHLFTIGQLADRTGLSVRTIRFWSDTGVLTPTSRSPAGYRLYDARAVARLDLVRTLRDLGLDLDTIGRILARQTTLTDVARAHLHAVDTQLRTLRLRRALLRSITTRDSTIEELSIMHRLARLSTEQRQQMIDDFVDRVFDGIDPHNPGAHLATAMRQLPAELPDDPTTDQVDAWLELAELVADADFTHRVRQMAVAGTDPTADPGPQPDPTLVVTHAGRAHTDGVDPRSPQARPILDRIIDPGTPTDTRRHLADTIDLFTDRRVERYWQLMAVLNDRPSFPPAA